MLRKLTPDQKWTATDYAGIERNLLRQNDTGGRTSLVRLAKGSRFPTHEHHGSEEVLVIKGCVMISGVKLQENDYLFTEPGERHDVTAIEDSIIYVASQKATPIVEKEAQ
jgi:quercetin dioxygenase-like cupin family protein